MTGSIRTLLGRLLLVMASLPHGALADAWPFDYRCGAAALTLPAGEGWQRAADGTLPQQAALPC
ncbi:MAG TPA: hypothetical protein VGE47_05160, partial [Burkholderiaceae bacterium]